MMTRELRAYLARLPGRCRLCCAHVAAQGHTRDCPKPDTKPNAPGRRMDSPP